jgi:hypothetical protein
MLEKLSVNRDQFLQEGYLVLRNVVPPDELEELRRTVEIMVDRQREIWAQQRGPDDPPGGAWETSAQPRLRWGHDTDLVDAQTAGAVEFWLHENSLGVSCQLLDMPHVAVTEMMMMCNPLRDHGPAKWHRDIHPFDTAPLQGYLKDIAENGPRYVQWNIPLYDDDVLWVVPGSHLRTNTEDEDRRLLENAQVPLPNGVQTKLNAGDGVVYITPILHWGSNYSTRTRRTLHGGYCNFTHYKDLDFLRFLSQDARATFERWDVQSKRSQDLTEAVLRAALAKDGAAFRAGLEALQPGIGDKGKLLLTTYLTKSACCINLLRNPEAEDMEPSFRSIAANGHFTTLNWGPSFAERFSAAAAHDLWQRFVWFNDQLQADEVHFSPSFQSGPMRYFFNEMPAGLSVESLIAHWGH